MAGVKSVALEVVRWDAEEVIESAVIISVGGETGT